MQRTRRTRRTRPTRSALATLAVAGLFSTLGATSAMAAETCGALRIGSATASGCYTGGAAQPSFAGDFSVGGFAVAPGSAAVTFDVNGDVVGAGADAVATWAGATVETDVSDLAFASSTQTIRIADPAPIYAGEGFFDRAADVTPHTWVVSVDGSGASSTGTASFDAKALADKLRLSGSTIVDLITDGGPNSGVRVEAQSDNSTAATAPVSGSLVLGFDKTLLTLTGEILGIDPSKSLTTLFPIDTAELRKVRDFGVDQWQLTGSGDPSLFSDNDPATGIDFSIWWADKLLKGPRGIDASVRNIPLLTTLSGGLFAATGIPLDISSLAGGVRVDPFGVRGLIGPQIGYTLPVLGLVGLQGEGEVGVGSLADKRCDVHSVLSASVRGKSTFSVPTILDTKLNVEGVLCGDTGRAQVGPFVVRHQTGETTNAAATILGSGDVRVVGVRLADADVTGRVTSAGDYGFTAKGQASILGIGGNAEGRINNVGITGVCVTPTGLGLRRLPALGLESNGLALPSLMACGKDSEWVSSPTLPSKQRSASTAEFGVAGADNAAALIRITDDTITAEDISVTLADGRSFSGAELRALVDAPVDGSPVLVESPTDGEFGLLLPEGASSGATIRVDSDSNGLDVAQAING